MATDINSAVLVGRLTRDMELKTTNSGFSIGNISIAVNSTKKDGDQWVEEVNFFDITLLGRRAESLQQYLNKGQQISVSGSLKQERWEQDGNKRSRVVIIANNIQLLGSNQSSPTIEVPGGQQQQQRPKAPSYWNNNNFEDDIPF